MMRELKVSLFFEHDQLVARCSGNPYDEGTERSKTPNWPGGRLISCSGNPYDEGTESKKRKKGKGEEK